jgi:hypothetical protein
MRTFDRASFVKAQELWRTGRFGPEWDAIKAVAANRGYIFPPTGTVHDDRDAEKPSQRAIVWRALQDNPRQLAAIVGRCNSWSEVVDRIIGMEDRIRAEVGLDDRNREWDKKSEPGHREDVMTLGRILRRLEDSAA